MQNEEKGQRLEVEGKADKGVGESRSLRVRRSQKAKGKTGRETGP
jgi:hypothetical protein